MEPCSTLTPIQQSELSVVTRSRSDRSATEPSCFFSTGRNDDFEASYLLTTGAQAFLPGNPLRQGQDIFGDPVQTDVAGFGAVRARLVRSPTSDCALIVDVGKESSVVFSHAVLKTESTRDAAFEESCDKARHFASLGLRTLSGQ